MSGHGLSLKRREPDDDLLQDLLNVTLSPPKRHRLSDAGVSTAPVQGSLFNTSHGAEVLWREFREEIPTGPEAVSRGTTLSGSTGAAFAPRAVGADERALVLYRPVTPPLFPGGPPSGSVDFPYKVNSSMLPIPQGTDSELTSHQLDFQSACSVHTATPSAHGLFQALDLSGSPLPLLPGQRRLNRVSSCSSIPRFAAEIEDHVMVEEVDKSAELAVIPWVPMTPIVAPPKIRPIVEEVDDEPDVDDMMGESMDIVNEDHISTTGDQRKTNGGPIWYPTSKF